MPAPFAEKSTHAAAFDRKGGGEYGPSDAVAFGGDLSAVTSGDGLGNGQAQSIAAPIPAAGAVRPVEPLENVRQMLG